MFIPNKLFSIYYIPKKDSCVYQVYLHRIDVVFQAWHTAVPQASFLLANRGTLHKVWVVMSLDVKVWKEGVWFEQVTLGFYN